MKCSTFLASAFLAAALVHPAAARDWPSAGGWKVMESENICYITNSYRAQGYYDITLIQNVDAPISVLIITNTVWGSIETGREYDVKVNTDRFEYEIDDARGVDIVGKKGVNITLRRSFVEDFASSNTITLYVGGTLAINAKLTGSSAAVGGLNKCLAALAGDKAAEEARLAPYRGIPEDPFKSSDKIHEK